MSNGRTSILIRDAVGRFQLPGVKSVHLDGIFGQLDDVIAARINLLESQHGETSQELTRFWRYAAQKLDADLHRAIQQKYLAHRDVASDGQEEEGWRGTPVHLKYIDPIAWLESKVRLCKRAGLHRSKPLSILDIGPGPGHFAFVARFYGHDVLGLELPELVASAERPTYLYDDLCAFYGAERIPYRITAGGELPSLGQTFDTVTAWLAAFNVHMRTNGQGDSEFEPWSPDDWEYFVSSCRSQWLRPNARLVMTLTRRKLSKESWTYLAARATVADSDACYLDLRL